MAILQCRKPLTPALNQMFYFWMLEKVFIHISLITICVIFYRICIECALLWRESGWFAIVSGSILLLWWWWNRRSGWLLQRWNQDPEDYGCANQIRTWNVLFFLFWSGWRFASTLFTNNFCRLLSGHFGQSYRFAASSAFRCSGARLHQISSFNLL